MSNWRGSAVKNWKRREILLLAAFVGFAICHVYGAAHARFGHIKRFEITSVELETWAREIDPSVRLSKVNLESAESTVTPTTRHWEFEVPNSAVSNIVDNWEHHFVATIRENGWRTAGIGSGSGGGTWHFEICFRNADSYCETYLYATRSPFPNTDQRNGQGRVRLSIDLFTVPYTRLREASSR
jgi:hypothetical protein